jgi:hypothetical protein
MGPPDFMVSTNWRGGPLVVVGEFSRLGNICAVDGSRILPLDESDLSRRVYVFPGETFYPLDTISGQPGPMVLPGFRCSDTTRMSVVLVDPNLSTHDLRKSMICKCQMARSERFLDT